MNTARQSTPQVPSAPLPATLPDWMTLTSRYVQELQYGQVVLTIHQGNVIEVQKTERTRLNQPKRG